MRIHQLGLAIILALSPAACGGAKKPATTTTTTAAETKSLYDRLGGKDSITAVVDDFVSNVAADDRVKHFFTNTEVAPFKAKLVDQICEATGGPCKYTGKDMRTVHTGMKITDADFGAVVEDLVRALDKYKVGEKEKSELLAALGGMKGDIVGH